MRTHDLSKMADSAKKEKIAAARKKLKQFQKTGKGNKSRDSTVSPKPKVQKTFKEGTEKISESLEQKVSSAETARVGVEEAYRSPDTGAEESKPVVQNQKDSNSGPVNSGSVNSGSVTADNKENQPVTNSAPGKSPAQSSPQQQQQQQHTTPTKRAQVSSPTYQPSASTESLQQLSRQINGILAESPVGFETEQSHSDILELETRNRDLAALLAQHAQVNEQLTLQNEQIRQHALSVQSQLEQERAQTSQKVTKEIGPLKEQLQVHIQTIGILVAEKTELQSQLAQSQKIAEQRFGEVEDLTGRLKTSRQRAGDLERTLSTANNSSQKLEQTNKESAKEVDRLKLELFKLNKSSEELKQNSSEVQEKLKAKSSECSGLQHSVEELKRQLEMAQLYNQQLSSQNDTGRESLQIVEQLQQERDTLASQVQQYTESFQKVSAERDQLTEQYQQYMTQMKNQNTQLSEQMSSLTEEREKLVTHSHDLEAAVVELQRKLEDVATQPSGVDTSVHAELTQELTKLQTEHSDLLQRHDGQIRDNAQLSRFLEEKECRIQELETQIEEIGDMEGDKAELLENIQSDKTALSRALTQNRDLKQQLAELQNGFVKMSNDNMEMLSALQSEQHQCGDLKVKMTQQEEEVTQLREMMSQKEVELQTAVENSVEANKMSHKEVELQTAVENSVEANKVKLLHEQIQDRLRHYEAQAQLVETLRKELHSAQDMVDALTTQNSELRTMLIRATETRALNPDADVENAQRADVLDSLQGTIRQLESERNQLIENLNRQIELTDRLSVKVSDMEEHRIQTESSNTENDIVPKQEYESVKFALDKIQDKYNRVMRDKADLSDKADELEHKVLQLQGETDTIGEYISLYHHQRALLQQREIQRNEYIAHLAKEKEESQDKLGKLQVLVMQLMGEKNMLHSYNEESRRPISPNVQPHVHTHNGRHDDWPDYTSSESDTESEVETIVGGKDDVNMNHDTVIPNQATPPHKHSPSHGHTPGDAHSPGDAHNHINHTINGEPVSPDLTNGHSLTQDTDTEGSGSGVNIPADWDMDRPRSHSKTSSVGGEDHTASKILNLLSEIRHSHLSDNLSFMEQQFHPCKYCKGRLQIL